MLNPSESGFPRGRRFWMNGAVVWSLRPRRLLRDMVALPRWRRQPAWRRSQIGGGLKELAQDEPSERVRRPGAGRKPAIAKDPRLLPDLEALVEPTTRGDPQAPLRWTCKSVRRLAEALQQQGHQVSRTLVAELLNAAGYSLQGNDSHPDRDAQFAHINTQVAPALAEQQPAISVDTKKKELVGISAIRAASIVRRAIRKRFASM